MYLLSKLSSFVPLNASSYTNVFSVQPRHFLKICFFNTDQRPPPPPPTKYTVKSIPWLIITNIGQLNIITSP